MKLLIADRDHNERTGISWLVKSYAIPFDHVWLAGTIQEVFQLIEAEIPDVVCIELDMIPKDSWESFKQLTKRYGETVIVMTAEATFERALEGIELHAYDLWVKPHSPDHIRRILLECTKERLHLAEANDSSAESNKSSISYRSLFVQQASSVGDYQLMLLQLEDPSRQPMLLSFLGDFPFYKEPVILPLSDVIVCIFEQEQQHSLTGTGHRLLREWEEKFSEALSLVIYDSRGRTLSLHEKYLHAKQALEIRFFKGYRQLSVIEQKIDWVMIDPFLTPSEQREWIEMLEYADKEQLKKWMYKEFLNKEEPYPEPGLLRTRLTSILAQVRRYMKSFYLDEGELEKKYHQVFETILYNPILYRIVQEFLLFLYEVLDQAQNQMENSKTDVIEQALRYLEENFHDPNLKLEEVAHYVDRSPAYFSSLVTKTQGSSFRQILTGIRIKEAKRLLLDTKLSIQQVAEKTGFANGNYFSKIFKENTGLTPRSFRNRKKI